MNIWTIGENSIEVNQLKKKGFHSNLNMEDNIDEDYAHEKRVRKDFKTKNLGESNDSYVQSDTLLLADLLENVRNVCLEIHEKL